MSLRTDLPNLPPIHGAHTGGLSELVTTGPDDFYMDFANASRTAMATDRSIYESYLTRRISNSYQNSFFKRDDMSALDSAKIRFLHQKILERFEESPTSADEELLQLFDFNLPNAISTYQALGRSEHPIFTRDRWLSEAAAKMTDEGYATWLNKNISNQKIYIYGGDTIRLRNPVPTEEPTFPYEMPAPQVPMPPPITPATVVAREYEEFVRAVTEATPQRAPFATRGFDLVAPSAEARWLAATNTNEAIPRTRNDQPEE